MDWECLRTSAENNMGDGRSHAIGGGGREARRSNAERDADFIVMQMSKDWVELTFTSPIRLDNT